MNQINLVDPIAFTQDLIRRPSVTPVDAGALDVLQEVLEALGFSCQRKVFQAPGTEEVDNLYARLGTTAPNFCFAGHTDVVPVGDQADWSVDPFKADVQDGMLIGRGAADMKGGIAAFVAAVSRFLADQGGAPEKGSISLLITGDEEGDAINGTKPLLQWVDAQGEKIDLCIVGEPTNPNFMGQMMKIGRRGSINGALTVNGVQGHVAYPERAKNPIPQLLAIGQALVSLNQGPLNDGNDHFQKSNLEIVTVDVGNKASNVIPASASLRFNVRFNDTHSGEGIAELLREAIANAAADCDADYALDLRLSGESFLTPPGELSEVLKNAVAQVTGKEPELSTSGGTSDARFIKDYCPVVEFGLVGQTMHKVDERVAVKDIEDLTAIYHRFLSNYFAAL